MFSQIIKKVQDNPLGSSPEWIANEMLGLIEYDKKKAVPIVEIAKRIGFSVRTIDQLMNNDSGYILISSELKKTLGTDKFIVLSKKIKYGKSRFVIAHEIGHYLFDFNESEQKEFSHVYTYSYNKETQNEPNEKMVNLFASNLLMPKDTFLKSYSNLKGSSISEEGIILELSEIFETTPKSVQKRIEELIECEELID